MEKDMSQGARHRLESPCFYPGQSERAPNGGVNHER